jgi:hypothetical protein
MAVHHAVDDAVDEATEGLPMRNKRSTSVRMAVQACHANSWSRSRYTAETVI